MMLDTSQPLSPEEFDHIYSKVPRLTVEIIIRNMDHEVYLTRRAIEPCKDQWHLPGGTVRFGEPLVEAVRRIALRELGITVTTVEDRGYIEYPSHYLQGLDSPVGIVFEVTNYGGQLHINNEAGASGWFSTLPAHMHADQDIFLTEHHYLNI